MRQRPERSKSETAKRLRTVRLSLLAAATVCACGPHARSARAQQDTLPHVDGSVESSVLKRRNPVRPASGSMAAPEDLSKALIAPGYLLQMEVYDTPEMDATLRVDADGRVNVPLAGPVAVAGNTPLKAEEIITRALVEREILKSPHVTLNVLQYATGSATVLGEVQSPGRIPLLAPRTLAEVLAAAGGETFSAGSEIDVQHTSANGQIVEKQVHYVANQSPRPINETVINPGDTVIVNRAGAVYVLGGVARPGAYLMVNGGGLNLLEAISLAQGTVLRASVGKVEILRANGEGYSRIDAPLKDMQKGKVAPTALQVNDIVYVPISGAKSLFIDGASIMGAMATASIYEAR